MRYAYALIEEGRMRKMWVPQGLYGDTEVETTATIVSKLDGHLPYTLVYVGEEDEEAAEYETQ